MRKKSIIFLVIAVLLAGCSNEPAQQSKPEGPLTLRTDSFHSVVDWLNNESFLYGTVDGTTYELHRYHLRTGESTSLFTRTDNLIHAELSPSKKHLLLHEAMEADRATVTVLNMESLKEEWSTEIDSTELTYEWNPFNESLIAFTAFDQEWNYKVLLADVESNKITPIDVPLPFYEWLDESRIRTVRDASDPSMETVFFNTDTGETEVKIDPVVTVASYPAALISTVMEQDGLRVFITSQSGEWSSRISRSGGVLPVSEYADEAEQLFAFEDTGLEGVYNLVQLSAGDNKELILDEVEEMPMACSPNGQHCLYGYQLTSIIDTVSKTVEPVIELEEDH